MINSAQIRAGRGLLKWTQAMLAARAAVSVVTLNMIESDQVAPRVRTLDAIRVSLEREGVRFMGDERDGYGVLLSPQKVAGSPASTTDLAGAGERPVSERHGADP